MDDEPKLADPLQKLPLTQKAAWEWAFRAGMVAAYFWSTGHFLSIDRYEKDNEKQDAQRSIMLTQLGSIDSTLSRIDEHMKNDDRRDRQIESLDVRVRNLEDGSNGPRHP